jgi:hypothetical protein
MSEGIDSKLAGEFARHKIAFPAIYFEALKSAARKLNLAWQYTGETFETLSADDKENLFRTLQRA